MKNKIIFVAGLSLLLPFISLAKEPEASVKANRQEDLKKQLVDTVSVYSAIVNSLERLSQRISDREDILLTRNGLDKAAQETIDSKRKILNDKIAGINGTIEDTLTKSAEAVASSDKPARPLKDFKKEANKIKTEILSAHKLIIEIIKLIKITGA